MSPKSKILRILSFAEVAEICNNENICLNLNVQIKERMVKPTESKSKVKLNNTKKYRHDRKNTNAFQKFLTWYNNTMNYK